MENKIFLLIMIFVLLIGRAISSNASVTFQQTKQVWEKMENVSGVHIPLYYSQDKQSNAYSGAWNIHITQGMLQDLQNADQIATLLGHELGHYVKQHYRAPCSMQHELEADKLGVYYCKKLGGKNCLQFFSRMYQLHGEQDGDGIHPGWSYRLKEVINAK